MSGDERAGEGKAGKGGEARGGRQADGSHATHPGALAGQAGSSVCLTHSGRATPPSSACTQGCQTGASHRTQGKTLGHRTAAASLSCKTNPAPPDSVCTPFSDGRFTPQPRETPNLLQEDGSSAPHLPTASAPRCPSSAQWTAASSRPPAIDGWWRLGRQSEQCETGAGTRGCKLVRDGQRISDTASALVSWWLGRESARLQCNSTLPQLQQHVLRLPRHTSAPLPTSQQPPARAACTASASTPGSLGAGTSHGCACAAGRAPTQAGVGGRGVHASICRLQAARARDSLAAAKERQTLLPCLQRSPTRRAQGADYCEGNRRQAQHSPKRSHLL